MQSLIQFKCGYLNEQKMRNQGILRNFTRIIKRREKPIKNVSLCAIKTKDLKMNFLYFLYNSRLYRSSRFGKILKNRLGESRGHTLQVSTALPMSPPNAILK